MRVYRLNIDDELAGAANYVRETRVTLSRIAELLQNAHGFTDREAAHRLRSLQTIADDTLQALISAAVAKVRTS